MKFILIPPAAAMALALCSCANSYSRSFAAASATLPRPPVNADGPWLGTWKSDANGHSGPLWCIVQPAADRPGEYDFRYRAGWGLLKFGDYTHTTPAKPSADGSLKFSGEMALPGGGGVYRVDGRVSRDSFSATYRSEGDSGTMTMKRPPAEAGD
ncbi:MAG: hypothetical protein ACO3JG_03750 [Luteolibacter sp.]